jgi:adenosylcobyric acid synthase
MLGHSIHDPDGVEAAAGADEAGLALLDVSTTFGHDKVLRLPVGEGLGQPVSGYEIHHGRLDLGEVDPFPGGGRRDGVFATMWHGSLESDGFRQELLGEVAVRAGIVREPSGVVFADRREARLDLLGDLVEEHLDVEALLELARSGAPAGLSALAPGSSR